MKYSLIISNTTSKEAYYYHLGEPIESSLYFKFNISVGDIPDAEYEFILIENPDQLDIVINNNNPFKSKYIQVSYNDSLSSGDAFLVTETDKDRIVFIESGLMRVGDYKEKRLQYDKQTKYTVYER